MSVVESDGIDFMVEGIFGGGDRAAIDENAADCANPGRFACGGSGDMKHSKFLCQSRVQGQPGRCWRDALRAPDIAKGVDDRADDA